MSMWRDLVDLCIQRPMLECYGTCTCSDCVPRFTANADSVQHLNVSPVNTCSTTALRLYISGNQAPGPFLYCILYLYGGSPPQDILHRQTVSTDGRTVCFELMAVTEAHSGLGREASRHVAAGNDRFQGPPGHCHVWPEGKMTQGAP